MGRKGGRFRLAITLKNGPGFSTYWALAELAVLEWYFAAVNDDDRDIALR